MLPHVCFDATCVLPRGKGASVYALSVLEALQTLNPPAKFTVLMRPQSIALLSDIPHNWSIRGVNVISSQLWHLFTLPILSASVRPNLLHLLNEVGVGWLGVPFLMTVHELPHLYNKVTKSAASSVFEYLSQGTMQLTLPGTCRRASHLLAVSVSTASDIVEQFGISPARITVTYEAAAHKFFNSSEAPSPWCQALPHPYVLAFATGDRREATEQVVEAFGAIADRIPHTLVFAGHCPDWHQRRIREQAARLNCMSRVHFTGFVADVDMPALYRHAVAFLEISLYEGFGLQVCEAMASGTVTISSNVSSLPEVVGDAGYLVPVGDCAKLADTILMVIQNTHAAKQMGHLARQRARQFSWEKCALETWSVIEKSLR